MTTIIFSIFVLSAIVGAEKIQRNGFKLEIEDAVLTRIEELRDVEELDLSNLGIKRIEDNVFKNIDAKILNLESNKLSELGSKIFSGLSRSLEILNLGSNEIETIDSPFVGFKNLKSLNFSNNPIDRLEANKFDGVPKTADILVENNNLNFLSSQLFESPSQKSLANDSNSTENTTPKNAQTSLLSDEFEHLANVFQSILNGKDLTTDPKFGPKLRMIICIDDYYLLHKIGLIEQDEVLPNNCTDSVIRSQAKYLDLKELGIKIVAKGWYQLQKIPIAVIDFENNNITDFSPELLDELPEDVEVVNFGDNLIKEIKKSDVKNVKVKALSFGKNQVETIEDGAFECFDKLKFLFFENNQISDLSFAASLPRTLNHLELRGNKIKKIPNAVLRRLENLKLLFIDGNEISEIYPNAFEGLSSLTTLRLTDNRLTKIGTRLPVNLEYLDLSHNLISDIEGEYFVELPKKILNLSSNKISNVSPTDFAIKSLEKLHLEGNHLSEINENTFKGVSNIRELNLKFNLISEIRPGTFKFLNSLTSFDVSDNPIAKLKNGAFFGLSNTLDSVVKVRDTHLKIIKGGIFESF